MKNNDWNIFLLITSSSVFVLLAWWIFAAPKHTVRYELDDGKMDYPFPSIVRDIENSFDERINFSREITWQEAIAICDSLNRQLQKYPIK